MPDLPTITVTDGQAAKMLEAYGSVEGYLDWLVDSIIEFVVVKERSARAEVFYQEQRDADEALRAQLRAL